MAETDKKAHYLPTEVVKSNSISNSLTNMMSESKIKTENVAETAQQFVIKSTLQNNKKATDFNQIKFKLQPAGSAVSENVPKTMQFQFNLQAKGKTEYTNKVKEETSTTTVGAPVSENVPKTIQLQFNLKARGKTETTNKVKEETETIAEGGAILPLLSNTQKVKEEYQYKKRKRQKVKKRKTESDWLPHYVYIDKSNVLVIPLKKNETLNMANSVNEYVNEETGMNLQHSETSGDSTNSDSVQKSGKCDISTNTSQPKIIFQGKPQSSENIEVSKSLSLINSIQNSQSNDGAVDNKTLENILMIKFNKNYAYNFEKCKVCDQKFLNSAYLLKHMKTMHESSNICGLQCDMCEETFESSIDLINHRSQHTIKEYFRCKVCEKKFLNSKYLSKHMKNMHGIRLQCDVCDDKFDSIDDIINHRTNHTEQNELKCEYCDICFLNSAYLSKHMKTKHETVRKVLQCGICDEKFESLKEYLKHRKEHIEKKCFTCRICNEKFENRKDYLNHKEHTKSFTCDLCGKKYVSRNILWHHKNTVHCTDRRFKCDVCSKSFKTSNYLSTHKKYVHGGWNSCLCEVCGIMLCSKSYLSKHMRVHSGVKAYECNVCKKRFLTPNGLRNHEFVHTGEKRYACDICGKRFATKNYIRKHKKFHAGVRQHKCPVCGFRFVMKSTMKLHMKTHLYI